MTFTADAPIETVAEGVRRPVQPVIRNWCVVWERVDPSRLEAFDLVVAADPRPGRCLLPDDIELLRGHSTATAARIAIARRGQVPAPRDGRAGASRRVPLTHAGVIDRARRAVEVGYVYTYLDDLDAFLDRYGADATAALVDAVRAATEGRPVIVQHVADPAVIQVADMLGPATPLAEML